MTWIPGEVKDSKNAKYLKASIKETLKHPVNM
jgi:hypothetical protein